MDSHRVVGALTQKIKYLNGINLGCFKFHTSQNVPKSLPSLTGQLCDVSLLTVCLSRQDGAIYGPPKHLWTSDRLKKVVSVNADCLTFGYSTHMNC